MKVALLIGMERNPFRSALPSIETHTMFSAEMLTRCDILFSNLVCIPLRGYMEASSIALSNPVSNQH